MELGDSRHTDGNVTVIPEMEYVADKDEENLKRAMSFLVDTFPHMKKVLEISQFQFPDKYKHLDSYQKIIDFFAEKEDDIMRGIDENINDYIGVACGYRLDDKYFRREPRLFKLLHDFYENYKTAKYIDLKKWFDEIIDICIRKHIFYEPVPDSDPIPVLELTEDYKTIGKDRLRMINPLRDHVTRTVFESETKYVEGARGRGRGRGREDGRCRHPDGKWTFGWPFLLRDMLHSNRIERYINGLDHDMQVKSIYIVHKGRLHFELRKDINPIRYFMKIEFVGNPGEEALIEDLIRNTRVHGGKLTYP